MSVLPQSTNASLSNLHFQSIHRSQLCITLMHSATPTVWPGCRVCYRIILRRCRPDHRLNAPRQAGRTLTCLSCALFRRCSRGSIKHARLSTRTPMENESSPARTTILGSFLRGRPRNSSQSGHPHELYPPPPPPPAPRTSRASRRNNTSPNQFQPPTPQPQQFAGLALSQMLRRRRSAGIVQQRQA
ncbi:hypothetical protein P691DRAFT_229337 [Macrolepiota fuliginosa MF-IS2]|uniref:Uncharacterized protein n=1 Tax=Macrolepiota fuliginosa MF-IS2 TaxID=1400762 RepID=A0A9P6BVU4_9AGAR|nr:hypothetical protein P691DRAFT_229337 [Macrolepiota fuliginosa MF-IS2]